MHVDKEACPLNLAPTSSTTAMLALGDALAMACLDARGFGREDFARSHPAGALGRRLLMHVRDVMRTGAAIPSRARPASVMDALHEITRKQLGMTAVLDAIAGTGRHLHRRRPAAPARTRRRPAQPDRGRCHDALAADDRPRRTGGRSGPTDGPHARRNQLLVVDAQGRLVGALNNLDLMNAKVI